MIPDATTSKDPTADASNPLLATKRRNLAEHDAQSGAEKYDASPARQVFSKEVVAWIADGLQRHCGPSPRVLDVAGGSGTHARLLGERVPAARVLSVDISRRSLVERAARCGGGNDALGDMEAIPFGDRTMDAVMFIAALHHSQVPLRTLVEARRVLRPGGRLFLAEPVSLSMRWSGQGFGEVGDGINFRLSYPFLRAQIEMAGFRLEEVRHRRIATRVLRSTLGRSRRLFEACDAFDRIVLERIPVIRSLGSVVHVRAVFP